ncbi:MAG: 50S ribosomal protein L10 [bacterium TMED198]|nr:MAG: 50S ribosomal protein L10 [bacterium TMED198]|tara:strand:+ start:2293 stop:2817 length:525 start_codon:yes stop_codon:yes gene_type:complete
MPNIEKNKIVENLTEKFKSCNGIYFTDYTGLDVKTITKLRKAFRANEVDYLVSKNTLTKIAAKNAGYEHKFDEILNGQIAIAYSEVDAISPARSIKEFLKENDKASLDVLGVLFEGELYPPEKYKEFADLPTKDVLLSKLLSALSEPMTKFSGTLNGAMQSLVVVLNNLKEKNN